MNLYGFNYINNYILDRHWSPFQPSLQIHVPFSASQKSVFSWAHRQLEVHPDPYVKTSQSKNVTTKRINIDKLPILTCAFSTEWPYFVLVCFSCLGKTVFFQITSLFTTGIIHGAARNDCFAEHGLILRGFMSNHLLFHFFLILHFIIAIPSDWYFTYIFCNYILYSHWTKTVDLIFYNKFLEQTNLSSRKVLLWSISKVILTLFIMKVI
jgi:hypothetical protein